MTVFYIVCHGETLFSKKGLMQGWGDSPLTNDAIEQTFALSNELKSIHFDGLYTSPSGRALKTASIIGSQIGQNPISVEALKEVSYGYLEGESKKNCFMNGKEGMCGFACFSGEDFYTAQHRIIRAMQEIARKHPNQNILIVSHSQVIQLLLGLMDAGYRTMGSPCQLSVPNGSISILKVEENHFELMRSPDLSYRFTSSSC